MQENCWLGNDEGHHIFCQIELSGMESGTEETIVKGVDVETMTEFYSGTEETFVKEVAVDSATDNCSETEESLVEEVVSHPTSQSHDGPTSDNIEQTRQESPRSHSANQGHCIELRNQQIERHNSAEMNPPHDPHRNVLEKSKLVTSSNAAEFMPCLLSTFLEDRKSKGIKSQDLLRRTFGVPILVLKIEKKPVMDDEFDARGMDTSPVWISNKDEECIINYLKTRGFAFLCRDGICFYFSVGNRSADDVNLAIDHMQEALRNICFGRFFGRISSLEDLVISFRVEGGHDPSLTWRFYYALSNNGISADVRQTGYILLRKYLCGILLLMFWLMGACIVSKAFRRK